MNKETAFVFDVDGVLLNWFYHLPEFLNDKGIPSDHLLKYQHLNHFICRKTIFGDDDPEHCLKLIKEYNASDYTKILPVFCESAIEYVRKLKQHGRIIALTCIGTDETSQRNRVENLEAIFGEDIFDEYHMIGINDSKEPIMRDLCERYNVACFADDRAKHIHEAMAAGLENSAQFTDRILESDIDTNLMLVRNWEMLYHWAMASAQRIRSQQISLAAGF